VIDVVLVPRLLSNNIKRVLAQDQIDNYVVAMM